MSIIEALSRGIPAIGFDVPGVNDLIQDGINGKLVEFGNIQNLYAGINQIRTDDALREKLTKNAGRILDDYSPEKIDRIWFESVFHELEDWKQRHENRK